MAAKGHACCSILSTGQVLTRPGCGKGPGAAQGICQGIFARAPALLPTNKKHHTTTIIAIGIRSNALYLVVLCTVSNTSPRLALSLAIQGSEPVLLPCCSTMPGLLAHQQSYHFLPRRHTLPQCSPRRESQPSCSCPCDAIEMWTSKRSRLDLLLQLAKSSRACDPRTLRGPACPIRPLIRPSLRRTNRGNIAATVQHIAARTPLTPPLLYCTSIFPRARWDGRKSRFCRVGPRQHLLRREVSKQSSPNQSG